MAALRALTLSLLLAAVALVPQGSAQAVGIRNPDTPTPVTLYMHLIDLNDFPINTQMPDDRWTVSNAWGLTTSTTTCLPDGTPGADVSQEYHTFYGYSTPGYVEYAFESDGEPRVHPERGISYDAHLDQGTPFTLYWYMTTQTVTLGGDVPNPSDLPTPVPNVAVTATIRAGDSISIDDRGYNEGEVLVQGGTEPATLLADQVLPATGSTTAPATVKALGQQPDGSWLYEFAVPMAIEKPVISRAFGYNLRVDVTMDNPACTQGADATLMPNVVRIASLPGHRPRMVFAVNNPIVITALHPQFVGDDLVVHAAVNAAWGNYDVAEPSLYTPDVVEDDMKVTIEGPTEAASLVRLRLVSDTHPHFMHQNDVTLVYAWPYKLDRAAPGVYKVHLEVSNDQHTAKAVADTQFEVGRNTALNCTVGGCTTEGPGVDGGDGRGAPAPAAPLAALALAGLAAAARRRGRGQR